MNDKAWIEYKGGQLCHTRVVMAPVADDHWVRRRHGYGKDDKPQIMELIEDVSVAFTFKRKTYKFEIAKGFVFDGASIPQFFWTTIGSPWDSVILLAALVHDACYSAHPFDASGNGEAVTRADADNILRHLCGILGMGFVRRNLVYMAVSSGFGLHAWLKETPYTREHARQFVTLNIL